MERDYTYPIMPEIQARYATRQFDSFPVSREEILPLLEAARYAPSCYNEQPWRFVLGDTPDTFAKLAETLAAGNAWAKQAPVLILVLATRFFKLNGEPNPYSRFDTGTASGFLQLEAVRRGFAAHCMAGYDADKARALFSIPETLDIIELIAIGRPANLQQLSSEAQAQEKPGTRMPLADLLFP